MGVTQDCFPVLISVTTDFNRIESEQFFIIEATVRSLPRSSCLGSPQWFLWNMLFCRPGTHLALSAGQVVYEELLLPALGHVGTLIGTQRSNKNENRLAT